MALNISYADYSALYPDGLNEEAFYSLLPRATAYVEVITANRAASAEGYKAGRVVQAVCAVINEMQALAASRGLNGARVTSVSNDGYTESYGAAASAESEAACLRSAAFRWLSGTGLMSAL